MAESTESNAPEQANELVFDLPQLDAGRAALMMFTAAPEGPIRLLLHVTLDDGGFVS